MICTQVFTLSKESGSTTIDFLPHKIWATINNVTDEAEDLGAMSKI